MIIGVKILRSNILDLTLYNIYRLHWLHWLQSPPARQLSCHQMVSGRQDDQISPSSPGLLPRHRQERLAGRHREQGPGDSNQWEVYTPSGRESLQCRAVWQYLINYEKPSHCDEPLLTSWRRRRGLMWVFPSQKLKTTETNKLSSASPNPKAGQETKLLKYFQY